MIVTVLNEQGLLEVEARVEIYEDNGPIADVKRVYVEGVHVPLSALSDYLLDELEQQALEEL